MIIFKVIFCVNLKYIERALSTNKTFEGFHNSLGECFRVMGRMDEAKSQFELALALNPKYSSAAYNLGTPSMVVNYLYLFYPYIYI